MITPRFQRHGDSPGCRAGSRSPLARSESGLQHSSHEHYALRGSLRCMAFGVLRPLGTAAWPETRRQAMLARKVSNVTSKGEKR